MIVIKLPLLLSAIATSRRTELQEIFLSYFFGSRLLCGWSSNLRLLLSLVSRHRPTLSGALKVRTGSLNQIIGQIFRRTITALAKQIREKYLQQFSQRRNIDAHHSTGIKQVHPEKLIDCLVKPLAFRFITFIMALKHANADVLNIFSRFCCSKIKICEFASRSFDALLRSRL